MTSKKDYEAIAKIMRTRLDRYRLNIKGRDEDIRHMWQDRRYGAERVAVDLADYFAQDNPQFDRARFLAACGF